MKKAKSRLFYVFAVLLGALFVIACLMGFAACGNSDEPEEGGDDGNGGGNDGQTTTYTFEAEDAKLWADESEMWYWLENDVTQGNMITGMGFLYGVQEVETASEGYSVGFLAHNNPTATFVIKSSKAVTGAKLTLRAASCDIDKDSIEPIHGSYVYGLAYSNIKSYAGADHDILTVNGSKVALSGTLEGNDSVFKVGGSITDMDLAMDTWGTLTATVDLVEGDNTIVLTHDGAGVNWDYIQIETDAELSWTKTNNDGFISYDEDYEPEDDGSDNDNPDVSGETEGITDRFVTGPYDEANKEYYTWGSALFNGSEINLTAVSGQENTYAVNGTSAPFDNDQLAVFWGNDEALMTEHAECEYIATVVKVAYGEEAVFTVKKTDKDDEVITCCPTSEDDIDEMFYTLITDVTGYTEGDELMSFVVTDTETNETIATYKIVLGTITSSAETSTPAYENALTLEAEAGAFINSSESYGNGTEAMTTEENSTYMGVTNVKNFNVSGDQIVLQVYADAAVESVQLDLYAWASGSGFAGYSYDTYTKLIQVNGVAVAYTGAFATTYDESTPQISATISLQEGMNYIVIELEKTGSRLNLGSWVNTGGVNVDRVELGWDGSAKLTEVVSASGMTVVSVKAADGTATLEAEAGAFINSSESYGNGTEAMTTEENSTYMGVTNVKNFNVSGDQIVLQVYADAAVESVQLDLYAWASGSGFAGYSYDTYTKLIQVNGVAVAYTGAFATTYDESTPQISATISLQEGMNYIVIELEKTGSRLNLGSWVNTGGVNVDRVELTWTAAT